MAETINERIRRFRKKLKYTQADVAKMLNMKTSTYSQMERMGNITCKMLLELTEILQTNALTLLYGEKTEEQPKETPVIIEEETAGVIDTSEIQPLVTQNVYEKIAVIAMRAFPEKIKQEIYEYIINKLKSIGKLKL